MPRNLLTRLLLFVVFTAVVLAAELVGGVHLDRGSVAIAVAVLGAVLLVATVKGGKN
jgi:hypothetical protein